MINLVRRKTRKDKKRILKKGIIKNTEWDFSFYIWWNKFMNIVERIFRFNPNGLKEIRYRYYTNNAREILRWEDYILKGKLSVYKYRKNI